MAQRLSTLSVGDTVKFGTRWGTKIRFVVTDKAHKGFPTNSVQFTNFYCDDTRPFDAMEPTNNLGNILSYGNNKINWSNLLQWANSAEKSWYSPTHYSDQAPDASHVGVDAYNAIPGMLNEWDSREVAMVQSVTRTFANNEYYGGSSTANWKIWLYDYNEVGAYGNDNNVYSFGTIFPYFKNPSKRALHMSEEGAKHSQQKNNGSDEITGGWVPKSGASRPYWIQNPYMYDYCCTMTVYDEGASFRTKSYTSYGVRYGISLDGDVWITSDKDSDGDYTVLLGSAPPAPEKIVDDGELRGGKETTIIWSQSVDPSIKNIGYRLQAKYATGDWTTIYEGNGTSYTYTIPFGAGTVQYRVCAINKDDGIDSEYTTTGVGTVFSNHTPTLTVGDEPSGTYVDTAPSWTFSVDDEDDADALTTTLYLDGTVWSTTTDKSGTFTFSDDDWLKITNGNHVMKISVTDGKETVYKDAAFQKNVTECYFQNIVPVPATEAPTELICTVLGDVPEDVELYTIEACTNGFDNSPTWEDIKEAVEESSIYKFTNNAKTSDKWGVIVRVHVKRGATEGYISSVLFNFLAGNSETSTKIDVSTGGSTSVSYSENAAGGNTVTIG